MRGELQELLREFGLPTLLVTHDYEDAAALADHVGVIVDGELRQFATPQEMVSHPADGFVAAFTGANLLHGIARPGKDGLTEIVLESGETIFSADSGAGRIEAVVYPVGDLGLPRAPAGFGAERDPGRDPLDRPRRESRAGEGRAGTAELTASSADKLGLAVGQPAVASFKATGTRLVGEG